MHLAGQYIAPPRAWLPLLLTPPGERLPLPGDRIWMPPVDCGRQYVVDPQPQQLSSTGHTRYREPDITQLPPYTP